VITLVVGENSFEIERNVQQLCTSFDGVAEKVDGATLEVATLPELLMGATLFASRRLVIIKNISENKTLWNVLDQWLPRISDDIHVVLIEQKPDKRTKTYKAIQKVAKVIEVTTWSERDVSKAEQWVSSEAMNMGMTMDKKSTHVLVERLGVDQWGLSHALEKLAVLDTITPEIIEEYIDSRLSENVFLVFEAALRHDAAELKRMLVSSELTEDAYRLFGLLAGQAFQFAVLASANKPSAEVAKELGVHPFALAKLTPYTKNHTIKQVIEAFAEADIAMKTSANNPWLLIERALLKIATK